MQNRIFLKRNALPLALIGAVVGSSLVGCNGGNTSGFPPFGNPTPTPTTPGPTPLVPFTFQLANGQKVTLTGTRTGNNISGTLKVAAKTAALSAKITANATFPFQITAGDYNFTGTVTPPRTFEISGDFGAFGNFTMSGLLPTATQAGTYSLTTNGVTDTGVIPIAGTPNGTPTPTPTNPPNGNFAVSGSLAVSNVSGGSSVVTAPFNTFGFTPNAGTLNTVAAAGTQSAGFGASDKNLTGNGTRRDIAVSLNSAFATNPPTFVPFSVGQRFTFGQTFGNLVQYSEVKVNGTSVDLRIWRAISGEAVVRAIGTNSIKIELINARMRGITVSGGVDTVAGEFTFNGTLTATGLTAKTQ